MSAVTDQEIVVAMLTMGGNFIHHLAQAFCAADATNQQRIKDAFADEWGHYHELALLRAGGRREAGGRALGGGRSLLPEMTGATETGSALCRDGGPHSQVDSSRRRTVMKRIAITITLDCKDDTPKHVIDWMGDNLLEHAQHEFGKDFCDDWLDGDHTGPPLADRGESDVTIVVRSIGS